MRYQRPTLLTPQHVLEEFVCASAEQTAWLVDHARQSHTSGSTKVLVVTTEASDDVVAYYAWAMAHIDVVDAPRRMQKGGGRYPQPVTLLARLGIHRNHEGRGIGAALLLDAVVRAAAVSDEIGCRGLIIHAESERARDFYLHVIPEFEPSPTDPLHLVLLLKDVRKTIRSAGGR